MRPTQEGSAVILNNIKGHPGALAAIGLLASRKRVGYLLDCAPEKLGFLLKDSVENPIPPVVIQQEQCHPLDPSNGLEYAGHIRGGGIACKAIFDCRVPYDQKARFERAQFMDVDPKHWRPDLF